MIASNKRITGTREWAVHNVNCIIGCSHNCRYCYARSMAIDFGRATLESWPVEKVRTAEVNKRRPLLDGTVMFPTTHDISPANQQPCITVIRKLLDAGNRVLIVTKPHWHVIAAICAQTFWRRDQILFRFTIGSIDDSILGYWEPGAPPYPERLASLKHAHQAGFATSVSIEPMLDAPRLDTLIGDIYPFITDSIWIGKMNHIRSRVRIATAEDRSRVQAIEAGQTDASIRAIYDRYKNDPKIRWKESIKQVVGLPLAQTAGEDQ